MFAIITTTIAFVYFIHSQATNKHKKLERRESILNNNYELWFFS